MAYGGMMGQAPQGVAAINGLPTNDVRELTVRSGNNISAGDVVDVEGGEVFKNVKSTQNINYEIEASPSRYEAMVVKTAKISDKYSVCIYSTAGTTVYDRGYLHAILLNNLTKQPIASSKSNLLTKLVNDIDIIPISDTLFFMAAQLISYVCIYLVEISNEKMSIVGNVTDKFQNDVFGVSCVKLNDSNKILMVSTTVNSGSYNIIQVTGKTLNIISRDNSITGFPDNSLTFMNTVLLGENKVLISACASSNKPVAVVGTFNNATNKMSFGTVAKDVFAPARQLRLTNDGNTIYAMCYLIDERKYVAKVLTVSGTSVSVASQREEIDSGSINPTLNTNPYTNYLCGDDIFMFNGNVVFATNNGMEMYQYDGSNPSKLKKVGYAGWATILRGSWQTLSIIPFNNKEIWYSYSLEEDSDSQSAVVVTPLIIYNNQFGNWEDTSKTAIALQFASSNQPISVGFGGYCECPNVTEGQMITSNGVMGYGVQDGWLDIRPEYEKNYYVVGSFKGKGLERMNVIEFGFSPSYAIIYANDTYDPSLILRNRLNTERRSVKLNIVWNPTGITLTANSSEPDTVFNALDETYYYIAFR